MDQLPMLNDPDAGGGEKIHAFTFGEPEPLMDKREMLSHLEAWHNGRWYEPPVSPNGLARSFDLAPHHASAIRLKVNLLTAEFVPSRWLSAADFRKWMLDFIVMGNGYLEQRDNLAGKPLALKHSLARYTRRGIVEGTYFFVPSWRDVHEYRPGRVHHLMQEHPTQEIYGVPEYLSALQSALLNEAATLFRRRYYLNGSHAGFVFYLSEETVSNQDAAAIRKQLKDAKGVGNFKNLFIHAPKGKKDGVQIIPISEVAAKDEFTGIKNCTRDDMLAAHRVPPQLIGVIPVNAGGFGNVGDALDIFREAEIAPLKARALELNDMVGVEAVRFRDPPAPAARS